MIQTAAILLLTALGPVPEASKAKAPPVTSATILARRASIREVESKALADLADGLKGDESGRIRALIEPPRREDGPSLFRPLPEVVPALKAPDLPSKAREARDEAATALLTLAADAAKVGRYSLADDCLRAVLDRRPDDREARRLLGFVPHAGGWATPYAAEKLKAGWVDHPKAGWVEKSWVAHLDGGELPGPVKPGHPPIWLPADEADDLRRTMRDGWLIETAHFAIRTNVPRAEAVGFGRRLEAFHGLFHALMADVLGHDSPLAQRYDSKATPRKQGRPHSIWYFASKAEYVNYLRPTHGEGVELELGHYDRSTRPGVEGKSYFFRDLDGELDVVATLYHEASHQLLFESGARNHYEKNDADFWVFEGLGTYFETVTPRDDGTLEYGGLVGPRIRQARIRLLEKGQFVPIGALVALDQRAFEDEASIFLHYAESMALAVFLMQADGTGHREAFLEYVRDAFKGNLKRGRGTTLEGRLGIPYAALDRKFLAYLKAGTTETSRPRGDD